MYQSVDEQRPLLHNNVQNIANNMEWMINHCFWSILSLKHGCTAGILLPNCFVAAPADLTNHVMPKEFLKLSTWKSLILLLLSSTQISVNISLLFLKSFYHVCRFKSHVQNRDDIHLVALLTSSPSRRWTGSFMSSWLRTLKFWIASVTPFSEL